MLNSIPVNEREGISIRPHSNIFVNDLREGADTTLIQSPNNTRLGRVARTKSPARRKEHCGNWPGFQSRRALAGALAGPRQVWRAGCEGTFLRKA